MPWQSVQTGAASCRARSPARGCSARIPVHIAVALGAGSRNVELVDRRLGIAGAEDVVLAVAVGADRGLVRTGGNRLAVNALLVGGEGSGADAARRHHELLAVASAAGLRNVGARDLRLGIAGRQHLVHAAVAVLALGHVGVAGGRGLGVNAVIVGGLLISVAGGAHRLDRRGVVRKGLDVGVAIGAAEDAVHRGLELGVVDMQADLLAVLVFRESGIVVAGQALVVAHLGSMLRRSPSREQQGYTENQTAALHGTPRFRLRNCCARQHSTMAEKGMKGQ